MLSSYDGPVELRTLTYFVAVADTGTVSGAAARLHVTQPGVSRQLRQLEREWGVDLFDRSGRRLHLSPAGRTLLPQARDLLARAEGLAGAARVLADGRLPRFTVAGSSTTLTDLVSPFLTTLQPDDPVPTIMDASSIDTLSLLRQGADLAITSVPLPADVASVDLSPLPLVVYVRDDHPWAGRATVTLPELAGVEVIGLPTIFPARSALDAALAADGLPALAMLEATNGTIAQALTAAGRGVAVVSDDPRFDLTALPLTRADGTPIVLRLRCVWLPGHPAADLLADLARRLAAWVRDDYLA